MQVRWIEAELERRDGLDPGPRVRPRLDRWRAAEAEVLRARREGLVPLLRVPGSDGPPVLVTMDRGSGADGDEVRVCRSYVDAVIAGGGAPILVPPGEASRDVVLSAGVALVITGGAFDIHPHHYGQGVRARLDRVDEGRTELELALGRAALAAGLPVLGVCGGMQVLAVAAGGTLVQDLPDQPTHEQPTVPGLAWHPVRLSGALAAWLGEDAAANSTHHQAVDDPGGFVVEGRSPDGVIEAMRHPDHPFAVGVQWHPERLGDSRLYARLVQAATPHPRAGDRAPART